jgi:hypothetical protein
MLFLLTVSHYEIVHYLIFHVGMWPSITSLFEVTLDL